MHPVRGHCTNGPGTGQSASSRGGGGWLAAHPGRPACPAGTRLPPGNSSRALLPPPALDHSVNWSQTLLNNLDNNNLELPAPTFRQLAVDSLLHQKHAQARTHTPAASRDTHHHSVGHLARVVETAGVCCSGQCGGSETAGVCCSGQCGGSSKPLGALASPCVRAAHVSRRGPPFLP